MSLHSPHRNTESAVRTQLVADKPSPKWPTFLHNKSWHKATETNNASGVILCTSSTRTKRSIVCKMNRKPNFILDDALRLWTRKHLDLECDWLLQQKTSAYMFTHWTCYPTWTRKHDKISKGNFANWNLSAVTKIGILKPKDPFTSWSRLFARPACNFTNTKRVGKRMLLLCCFIRVCKFQLTFEDGHKSERKKNRNS